MTMAATVLLVEDERKLRDLVRSYLERAGFTVLSTGSGAEAISLASATAPDLVVLDLGLPDIPGESVARELRAAREVPILMLTARATQEDRITGLELGADDYVTKPFRISELIARVNAFLRRSKLRGASIYQFGPFELDLTAHKLFRQGNEVELTAKEFRLLAHLASRSGCALTRDDILDAVWGRSVIVTPRSIDRCVATLRAKIEPDPHRPVFIQTIRDIGYRFET